MYFYVDFLPVVRSSILVCVLLLFDCVVSCSSDRFSGSVHEIPRLLFSCMQLTDICLY